LFEPTAIAGCEVSLAQEFEPSASVPMNTQKDFTAPSCCEARRGLFVRLLERTLISHKS